MTLRKLIGTLILFVLVLATPAVAPAQDSVTCYVSLDYEFSKTILDGFQEATGIKVVIQPDTEATKTVGLVNRIISERKNPRCDVYWNNEVGQTIRLKNEGLLQPYVSPNAATIPAAFKDKDGYWTGLAARARVFIFDQGAFKDGADLPRGLADLADPKWKGKITMAKPLTGTTMTHVAALMTFWGEEKTKDWLDSLLSNDIYWSRGNAMVMRDVGRGAFAWGPTDTDDANVSRLNSEHHSATVIPDQGEGGIGTLVIPNSVTIVKGAKNLAKREETRRLHPQPRGRATPRLRPFRPDPAASRRRLSGQRLEARPDQGHGCRLGTGRRDDRQAQRLPETDLRRRR